jgi:2-methylcitrate dehydratase PrpD
MARGGFLGPRTVLDGRDSIYRAFAPSVTPNLGALVDTLGSEWVMPSIAFKPYPCGTMIQPFIDCALQLRESDVHADQVRDIVCDVAEGTVPRLWEPLATKHRPPTPYAAKFSTPFCMAVGFLGGRVGLAQFTEPRIRDAATLAFAQKIRYRINPHDEYPRTFTGHLRATLTDGSIREFRQPFMRGGAAAPLTQAEIDAKFLENARYGGWQSARAERLLLAANTLFSQPALDALEEFRA